MIKIFRHLLTAFIAINLISCGMNKETGSDSKINTKPNRKYIKSRQAFEGKLDDNEYTAVLAKLSEELNTNLDSSKTILIHYHQKAPNCISMKFDQSNFSTFVDRSIATSSRVSENTNMTDFFVYAPNAYFNDLLESKSDFILDSGFFYNNIFTIHENCRAFFILKPNGNFLKYYGEDYYSEIYNFLKKPDVNKS